MVVKVIKHQNIRNGLRPFPFHQFYAKQTHMPA
jgi:transposase InsO family protein